MFTLHLTLCQNGNKHILLKAHLSLSSETAVKLSAPCRHISSFMNFSSFFSQDFAHAATVGTHKDSDSVCN